MDEAVQFVQVGARVPELLAHLLVAGVPRVQLRTCLVFQWVQDGLLDELLTQVSPLHI